MLDTKTESPEILSSLSTLSAFYADNSAVERRLLRAKIEKQGRNISEDFLAAAETVTAVRAASEYTRGYKEGYRGRAAASAKPSWRRRRRWQRFVRAAGIVLGM